MYGGTLRSVSSAFESPDLGLLSAQVTIGFAPAGVDVPAIFGNTLTLEELPYNVLVPATDLPSRHEFYFEFMTAYEIVLSELVVIDEPESSLPLLEVTFNQVRFMPVPEPSSSTIPLVAVSTVFALRFRSRAT